MSVFLVLFAFFFVPWRFFVPVPTFVSHKYNKPETRSTAANAAPLASTCENQMMTHEDGVIHVLFVAANTNCNKGAPLNHG